MNVAVFLGRRELARLEMNDEELTSALYNAKEHLFSDWTDNERASSRRPSKKKKSFKKRLFNSKSEDRADNGVQNSFQSGRNRNTKIVKSKIPSFSRPGSGLLRKVSNVSDRHRNSEGADFPLNKFVKFSYFTFQHMFFPG